MSANPPLLCSYGKLVTAPNASDAGTLMIGGDLSIHRIGYGTMRLAGPGVIGPPRDIESARATLRLLPELGVNFIETSIAFGPLSEMLVRDALHPYRGMVIGSSGGLLRPGPFRWAMDGRPAMLRAAVEGSLKLLGVERLDLWQLQRVDPKIPIDDQFGAIAEMQRAGLIPHVGLCNVSVDEIDAAARHFIVATVQNRYHVIDRTHEPVLERCERDGIPFIPYFPLATGALAATDSILTRIAATIGITPGQAALAWLLRRSKLTIVIPGTTRPEHARENVAAAAVRLTDE
jgi:pyridoxine 4-dehydrogenase